MFSKAKRFNPADAKNVAKEGKNILSADPVIIKTKPSTTVVCAKSAVPSIPVVANKPAVSSKPLGPCTPAVKKTAAPCTPLTGTKTQVSCTPGAGPKPTVSCTTVSGAKPPVATPALAVTKSRVNSSTKQSKCQDVQSQCSSVPNVKPFLTPKPAKPMVVPKAPTSLKKALTSSCNKLIRHRQKSDDIQSKLSVPQQDIADIIKCQEVEIRNKNSTIAEYCKEIEELRIQISKLGQTSPKDNSRSIEDLTSKILLLERRAEKLESEVSDKQVELNSLENLIGIRDSLCQDLQQKLTAAETVLAETAQRLEMVKGHHALALEANESIRREYKAELEAMKLKLEEEKQFITLKSKADQETIRSKYNSLIDTLKTDLAKEKDEAVLELQQQIAVQDGEMKAKLEQVEESAHERLRLCEIQFEERYRSIQEHWSMQEEGAQALQKEASDLKYSLRVAEEQVALLKQELTAAADKNNELEDDNLGLTKEVEQLKETSKNRFIDFENQVNKLTFEADRALKEKKKYELSLTVTHDIVQVLSSRLRESDDEVEKLEGELKTLREEKLCVDEELVSLKGQLTSAQLETAECKEALARVVQSSAALAAEHAGLAEAHEEALRRAEGGARRDVEAMKTDLIEGVDVLKQQSETQIQQLRDELEKRTALCALASAHAAAASAAGERARGLLAAAARDIERLEQDNRRLTQQIQDQQSLVVELSLLRQENEELASTVLKHSATITKMKKADQSPAKPKSPAVMRKKLSGKENAQIVVSPLRERNH